MTCTMSQDYLLMIHLYIINNSYAAVQSATSLSNDLEKINQWSSDWAVTFNPERTKSVTSPEKIHIIPCLFCWAEGRRSSVSYSFRLCVWS